MKKSEGRFPQQLFCQRWLFDDLPKSVLGFLCDVWIHITRFVWRVSLNNCTIYTKHIRLLFKSFLVNELAGSTTGIPSHNAHIDSAQRDWSLFTSGKAAARCQGDYKLKLSLLSNLQSLTFEYSIQRMKNQ